MDTITIPTALGISLLGIAIVFFMLILIMCMIIIMGAVMKTKAVPAPAVAAPAPTNTDAPPAIPAGKTLAKGSLGSLDLHGVDERTAAMLMAVVADKMQAPLNELYFKSIKEIK